MLSRKLIKNQPGRRGLTYAAAFGLVVLTLDMAGSALAVHDEEFQLDGDVSASTTTSVGGATQLNDWDTFFDSAGQEIASALTGGFTASDFIRDFRVNPGCSITAQSGTFCTADQSTFATGSKDTLDITPGWQCNFDNNVNSKIDIMNAYALAYTRASDDHFIIYFGMEKNAFTGTNDVGFWFLRSNANCSSTGGSEAWSGNHVDGDVLVVSEFTSGGGVSDIFAYKWSDADGPGGTPGFLDPNPLGSGGDCKGNAGDDAICATTNSGTSPINTNITTPWLTSNKNDGVGNTVRATEFFEGGIDITEIFGLDAPSCFNTFIGDTRSSVSLTATLFDFARGRLGECVSSISSAQKWLPNDDATVTVTGAGTWGGTVDFTLYEDSGDCNVADPGVSIYSVSDTVSNGDPNASTSNTLVLATATKTYSWFVVFTPDGPTSEAGVSPASHCETTDLTITN